MKDFGIIIGALAGAWYLAQQMSGPPKDAPQSQPKSVNPTLMLSVPQNPGNGPINVTLQPVVVSPGGPVSYFVSNTDPSGALGGASDIPSCAALPRAIASYQVAGVDPGRLAVLQAAYGACPK